MILEFDWWKYGGISLKYISLEQYFLTETQGKRGTAKMQSYMLLSNFWIDINIIIIPTIYPNQGFLNVNVDTAFVIISKRLLKNKGPAWDSLTVLGLMLFSTYYLVYSFTYYSKNDMYYIFIVIYEYNNLKNLTIRFLNWWRSISIVTKCSKWYIQIWFDLIWFYSV